MNSTLVIARRELAEKRFVLAAAFAFAMLALLIPLFPGVHLPFLEVVALSSGWLAIGFSLGLATTLGASTIGRELSDNRLSFYFARPVSAAAIWFGKLLASAVLVTASFIIIGTPALLTGIDVFIRSWIPNTYAFVGAVALAAAILFFAAHVLGTMVRSRSAWIAVDFACLVVTTAAVWAVLWVPLRARTWTVTEVASIILGLSAAIALVAGGVWQLAHGRTDRRLNHFALSRFLWSGATVGLVFAGLYVAWAMSVSPGDLVEINGIQAGHGWVLIEGNARHRGDYRPVFLVNTVNRHALRIGVLPWWGRDSSLNGNTVAWMQPASAGGSYEVMICRLDAADPRPEPTGITTSARNWLAISDDGKRVLLGWRSYTIYDLTTRRSLGSFRVDVPADAYTLAYFVSPSIARVHVISRGKPGGPGSTTAYEYDSTTRSLRQTGMARGRFRSESPDHLRMLLRDDNGLSLAEARTGIVITALSSNGRGGARFLADGSIALTVVADGTVVVRHLTRDGALLREVPIGRYFDGYVAEGYGHRALVELNSALFQPAAMAVVNLDRGLVERIDPQLRRVIGGSFDDEVLCQTATGVVSWNLSTGAKRLIAGR